MAPVQTVQAGPVTLGGGAPLVLIAGPCVIESERHTLMLAEALASIASRVGVPLIFKASYDKANRTSGRAFRGPGLDEGVHVLKQVKERFRVALLTDVHEPAQVE